VERPPIQESAKAGVKEGWKPGMKSGTYQRQFVRNMFMGAMQQGEGTGGKFGKGIYGAARTTSEFTGFMGRNAALMGDDLLGFVGGGVKGIGQDVLALRRSSIEGWNKSRATAISNLKSGESLGMGMRSSGGHLAKGAGNVAKTMTPGNMGLNLGLAAVMMSGDNMFDPETGMAKSLAENIAAEQGFMGGMSVGAAIGTAAWRGGLLGTAALTGGMAIGAMAGAALATSAVDAVWETSHIGNRYGKYHEAHKSKFVDSEQAYTMRQRAMQSINRSQLSARSAMGGEGAIFHS